MNTARTLFPGAMGPDGFISCFDHLIDDSILRRKLILKGGPGVGKSTFMRRVHAALCANGEPSTLYFCSGRPGQPRRRGRSACGAADSGWHRTAYRRSRNSRRAGQHHQPGRMSERTGHAAAPAAYPRLHGRSRRLFAPRPRLSGRRRRAGKGECRHAARRHGPGAPLGDDAGARSGRPLPRRAEGGRAAVRPVITDALTPKGEISLIGENAPPRVIRLLFHWGMDGTPSCVG